MKTIDIEDLNRHFDACISREFEKPSLEECILLAPLVQEILDQNAPIAERELRSLFRKYKFSKKRSYLFQVYLSLLNQNIVSNANENILRKTLQIKAVKSWSGITSITVFTSPYPEYVDDQGNIVKQSFSCEHCCSYCPNEPGQPRSYLKGEPGVLRANKNNFDCVRQMHDRMQALYLIGSSPMKCEIIVSGGTWTSYPIQYRREFCRDIYYAANTFWDPPEQRRPRRDLQEEILINRTATSRIVGLTIETRPDTINPAELIRLREFGVTRVQLGVQHTDNVILDLIKRRCPIEKAVEAIELLKRNCFKVDLHWMPNLPGATPEKDRHMLIDQLLGTASPVKREIIDKHEEREYWTLATPELQADQWKIYPTAVTPWTEIEEWYRDGKYVQYSEDELFRILVDTMGLMFPWIRCNRIIRDIPHSYLYNENTGSDNTNMRQEIDATLKSDGVFSMDIRNREVKNNDWDGEFAIVIRKYNANNGDEYFISAESRDNKRLYGFVRLRLDDGWRHKVFPELVGAALIREVKVYGDSSKVGDQGKHVQHKGLGRTLVTKAEAIARENQYTKIAVIASEGTRKYYEEKLGYLDEGHFMTKLI
jgi:histone acetyltransferase (RNA polymerase elongator complex component)